MRESFDYILLTALAEEHEALVAALRAVGATGPKRFRAPGAPTGQEWGLPHPSGTLRVLSMAIYGMGEEKAREATRLLLAVTQPQFVGFVGIAGAASEDAEHGDILLADRIWSYELSKVSEGSVDFRGPEHRAEGLLLDRLRHLDAGMLDAHFPREGSWPAPRVGVIASGDKVVANDHLKRQLLGGKWNVIGFEMEGHGFADEVVRAIGSERWFMVRSVSDRADKDKSDEFRLLACARAAQYAAVFLMDCDLCVAHQSAHRSPADDGPTQRSPAAGGIDGAVSNAVRRLCESLAERSPDDFLRVAGQVELEGDLAATFWRSEAVAWWRKDRPKECHSACVRALGKSSEAPGAIDDGRAQVLRLRAWARHRQGDSVGAAGELEGALARVESMRERGRWADLLAQCYRFSGGEANHLLSLTFYAQARRLKAEGGDSFGEVIALQQMARVCTERLELGSAGEFLEQALAITPLAFPQAETCDVTSLLGLAWIGLLRRDGLSVAIARRRLNQAGGLLAHLPVGPLERDLRAAAAALAQLSKVLTGVEAKAEFPDDVQAVWANVVHGQARVAAGGDLAETTAEVLSRATGRPSIVPERIPSLLSRFVQMSSGVASEPRPFPASEFWPLSTWLSRARATDAPRLIERVAVLYASVLGRVAEVRRGVSGIGGSAVGLARSTEIITSIAREWPDDGLGREATIVAEILRSAAPMRNRWAHDAPGPALQALERELLRTAEALVAEARMLRTAVWTGRTTILLGGESVDLEPFAAWDPERDCRTLRMPDGVISEVESTVCRDDGEAPA